MRMLALLAVLAASLLAVSALGQPIFDYVAAPDGSFTWEVTGSTAAADGGSVTTLDMISQKWQGGEWKHRIAIARPALVKHPELCVLVITGGNPVGAEFALATLIANMIGMPIAVLGDIPNQPLFDGLREDAAISYTFTKYLETGDASWPLLFPMTKAAVRAMDAIQGLSERDWGKKVDGFVVTGGSKRGWTTWFTGEVDQRVKGIAPMVYDNLNLPAQMAHHLRQWGAYSEQIDDYTKRGLPDMLAGEEGRALSTIVDPYTYRDRATMPKLIIAGTNDPYWPLGAADNYFTELPEPRRILYVPNSGHGLDDRVRVLNGLAGFVATIAGEAKLPQLSWTVDEDDAGVTICGRSDTEPKKVLAWTATSPTSDFRKAKWESVEVEPKQGSFGHLLETPQEGYAALFLEFTFDFRGRDFPLSTLIRMIGAKGE